MGEEYQTGVTKMDMGK